MEKAIPDLTSVVNGIVAFVRGSAQEMEIGDVERRLLSMVMDVGRAALAEFVATKGTGYVGKETSDAQGYLFPYVRSTTSSVRCQTRRAAIPGRDLGTRSRGVV
jgi:hypothetical protein